MKGIKTVFERIALMAAIGILAGCSNPNDPGGGITGGITGKALFSGGNNHSGILISLEESGGAVAQSVRTAAESGRMAARAVTASTSTGSNGAYEFNNVIPGTYTVYASSRDSREGAVTTNVIVSAGARAVAADLQLTPVGSLSGRIKLDGGETGSLGFLVFLAGTSYMAITNDAGDFTISGIPAGSGYDVVIMKGNYTVVWKTDQAISGGQSVILDDKTVSSSDLNGTGGTADGAMIWKGASAAAPANPQPNWVYYNTTDEKLYVYDGGAWKVLSQNNGDAGDMMIWKGAFASAPASPQPNWVYYNTADEKLYVYDGAWQILADNSDVLPAYGISLDKSGIQTFPAAVLGYSAQTPLSVTIINTGKQDTGALTLGLSGSGEDDFTLNETGVAGIAPGGTYTFTAAPKTGLAAGTYTALVTVDGANINAQTFTLYFTVNPVPSYGIVLSQTSAHVFPAQNFGYGDQSANALAVTITNGGDQNTGNLTVTVSPANIFTLSPASISGIGKAGTASFTVKPVTGLAASAQPYAATVTVSGGANITARSFAVSFTVNPPAFSAAPSINAVTPGTGSLRIDWSAAVPAPDSYKVYWKKGSHSTPAAVKTGPDNGSAAGIAAGADNYTISGLAGAAEYSVFVEAVKTGYGGGESAVSSATAIAGFTGSLSLSVTSVTENSLNYSITNSGLSPSAVDSYDIYYMEGDQTAANVLSNNVKVNKTAAEGSVSLNPGAFYTVLAVAKKANYSDSNPSNAVNLVFSPAINLAGGVGQNTTYGQGWKYSGNVYTILDGAELSVTGATVTRRIEAEANAAAELTLNNAHITGIGGGSAFKLNAGADVTLTLAGTSELKTAAGGSAGLQTTGATLTIEGTGSLAAEGAGGGAGIGGGGGSGSAGGTITITGSAVVTARGSYYSGSISSYGSAGIGGGGGDSGSGGAGGNITISGSAVVTAQGGRYGAGIGGSGGGSGGAGGNITISGSAVVTAHGGSYGAGIGGGGIGSGSGSGGAGGSVTILGGTVIAKDGGSASGIGPGRYGAAGTITPPQNAVVFASSAPGLSNNLGNGISVGSATIAINGAYPAFSATVTLQNDMTVPAGAALTVPAGLNLNKNGHTISGSVVNSGGLIFDNGPLRTPQGGFPVLPPPPAKRQQQARRVANAYTPAPPKGAEIRPPPVFLAFFCFFCDIL
jgi:hypothetical protein